MLWTAERVEQAVKLWEKGLSASQVAESLGVSRNAVLGKLHRMGKTERATPISIYAHKWDADSDKKLLILDDAGESPAQIAEALGRTQVAVKHRLSVLSKRRTPRALAAAWKRKTDYALQKHEPRAVRKQAAKPIILRMFGPERLEPVPLPPEPPVEHKRRLVSLMKLKSHHCRYPFGQPGEKGFGFCGARVQDDSSYCAEHYARCYQPQWAQAKARVKAEWIERAVR